MIVAWLAALSALNASASSVVTCPDFSGHFRFGTVSDSCLYVERDHTFPRSNSPTPPRDGVFLVPEMLVADGVFIPENSTFAVEQKGCDELVIRYEESILNQATQRFERRSATKTVALASDKGLDETFRWRRGSATAERHQTVGSTSGVPGLAHFREDWSLARESRSSGLLLRATKRNWGLVLAIPDVYHEELTCRMARLTPAGP